MPNWQKWRKILYRSLIFLSQGPSLDVEELRHHQFNNLYEWEGMESRRRRQGVLVGYIQRELVHVMCDAGLVWAARRLALSLNYKYIPTPPPFCLLSFKNTRDYHSSQYPHKQTNPWKKISPPTNIIKHFALKRCQILNGQAHFIP